MKIHLKLENCFKILKMAILTAILYSFTSGISAKPINFFISKALKNSPYLKAGIYSYKSAKESYLKESIFKSDPILSLSYSNVPLNSFPSLDAHAMSGLSIGVSQKFAFPWESAYRKKSFRKKYLSKKEEYEELKNRIIREISILYHGISFLHTKISILKKNKSSLKDILNTARAIVSVGKMNSSQLLKLQADIAILGNQILEVKGLLKKWEANMEGLCGEKINWKNDNDYLTNWKLKSNQIKLPKDFQIKKHPLYRKMKFIYEASAAKKSYENSALFPDVTIGANYRIRQTIPGKDKGEDFISIQASTPIPLFYGNKNRHKINEAEEKMKEARENFKQVKINLQSSWRGEKENAVLLKQAYTNSENEIVPYYLAAYKAQLGSLPSGTVSLIDVLDAYRRYLNASLEDAKIYRDLQNNITKLNYLLYQYPGKKKIKNKNKIIKKGKTK